MSQCRTRIVAAVAMAAVLVAAIGMVAVAGGSHDEAENDAASWRLAPLLVATMKAPGVTIYTLLWEHPTMMRYLAVSDTGDVDWLE